MVRAGEVMPCRFQVAWFLFGLRQLRKHDWVCFSAFNAAAMRKEQVGRMERTERSWDAERTQEVASWRIRHSVEVEMLNSDRSEN